MSIRTNETAAVRKAVGEAISKASRHLDDGGEVKVMFTGNAPNQRPQVVYVPLSNEDRHPERLITRQIKKFDKISPLQVHPA
jgi:hypothetical protein